eukprot:g39222.t1
MRLIHRGSDATGLGLHLCQSSALKNNRKTRERKSRFCGKNQRPTGASDRLSICDIFWSGLVAKVLRQCLQQQSTQQLTQREMSDSSFSSVVHRPKVLVDITDAQWLADSLSDDDIDHNDDGEGLHDDIDESMLVIEYTAEQRKKKNKDAWGELALSGFLEEAERSTHTE